MRAVLLDAETLGPDINLEPMRAVVDRLDVYQRTDPRQCQERLRGADVAITNKVRLDRATLRALPDLKLICVLATGTDNIDGDAAREQGITVRNIRAYGTASVAQHTLMLMLALANRLPLYQRDLRDGQWQRSNQFCLQQHRTLQLQGRHLVIVGSGELGRRVATLAEALDMRVSFSARPGSASDTRPPLPELAPEADVLSLHCPLTADTRNLVNETLLDRLRPGALLINCARGGIIDERAALGALRDGRLGGLAVDVLPQEPPRDGHPLLDALDEPLNLIVTPHNAWISPEARQRVVELTVANLEAGP